MANSIMNVSFLLFDGFSNFVLSCLLEPLRVVEEQYGEGIQRQILSIDDGSVWTSSGLEIKPTASIADLESTDILVILASNSFRQHVTADNLRILGQLVRQSETVIAADAGAWVLAGTGLLDDQTVATHWQIQADFAEEYPQVHLTSQGYLREGRYWSCGAASSGLDLMLDLIAERFGADKAVMASSMFMQDSSSFIKEQLNSPSISGKGSNKIYDVINIMAETLERPLSLRELSERAYVSPRSLNRLFQSEMDMSPGRYYQNMRLARARELAEGTELGLHEIALRCGYADSASLSKAFKRIYGQSIRQQVS
ncbi:Transcriptional regulator GlxA family, contains an amidase domain and an AraC-type DNA-binding HTH domain [Cohaesibacter marisflavi]|uniref:Transcriptional regulator GlxA family, contains an amidase domain and an AraC-type DNA-binding HTH domain n=2 Tax=Cohaesibacter marisflavi TaxID=655353 RepID=A0A1I5ASX0_9HYPH|nr:Transcriptional regulator GlxA family, contains an amidase domain and an AraC-type DNA-binding HTH domain [Cohaesibacter marisflavi]